MRRFRDGLATTLAGAAIPYGYTLVVWSTGSVLADAHGSPDVVRVVMFVAGAAGGYALLRLVSTRGEVHGIKGISRNLFRAMATQGLAISAAVAVAVLIAKLWGLIGWPLAPFLSTVAYLTGTAISEAREVEEPE